MNLAVLTSCIIICASDFISVSEIPTPFNDNLIFGKTVREIRLEGNENTRDELIYKAMATKVGDVYSMDSAQLDRKWIVQLRVFTSVFFQTVEEEEDSVVLVVTMTEGNKYVPAPIVKVTDENGVSVGALFSTANVGGWAAKATVYFTVGGATNFGARLKDPWVPGRSWFFGYQFDYKHSERRNEIYDFDESSDDIFFQLTRNLTNNLRWGPQLFYLTVKSDSSDITLSESNRDYIPGLGVFLQYDGRNMPIYPTQGVWLGANVKKWGLGGVETDYWQFILDGRGYIELGSPRHSIALYSLATLSTGEVGVDYPVYMQFNLGGANSVRGWELGSRDGMNQFINTVEYWYVLMRHKRCKAWFFKWAMGLQLGAFGDIGTAWNNNDEFHSSWIGGGGLGLRILLPTSVMFRLDLAVGQEGIGVGFFISGREKGVAQLDRVR
jgi:outer membrane protein assembly factor BamA